MMRSASSKPRRQGAFRRGVVRNGLVAAAAAVTLVLADVRGQSDDEDLTPEERAAARAAAEQAEAERERARVEQWFANLAQRVRELRQQEEGILRQREADAQADLRRQEQAARDAVARRDAAEARSAELDRRWEANEVVIAETTELLEQHQGNLGELFGVTRQVAGDAATTLQQSLLTAQYAGSVQDEERADFMRRLAAATALPSITELERLWFELHREMTDAGKVVRFTANVRQTNGEPPVEMGVVRVGPFTAVADGRYLGYLSTDRTLTELNGELSAEFREIGRNLGETPSDAGYTSAVVDPASGALLGLYLQRPSNIERIEQGEVVGYVIIAVGVLGVLVALFQYGYLIVTRMAVNRQLRNLNNPTSNNPLGRVLLAFRSGQGTEHETSELLELRLSEAVLHEVPKLERFQSFLRLAVAAGPLLGLIGTVIGMIITFHAITAAGTSDPTLMARGIGQAMIATVLGLGIAIPLLFINAGLVAFSRSLTQTLDEQSQALLAESIANLKQRG